MAIIGIIGGSGLDDPQIIPSAKKEKVHTPYGATSDAITVGEVGGTKILVIPRHGADHSINPSNVNYRANIWALKELGATHILAPTACGSLRDDIKPGSLVFIDQFIDRTTRRMCTFYEGSTVCHIPMAEPFCPNLRSILTAAARKNKIPCHERGTMVTIEGPRFSTRAESHLYRSWGADVVNMTTVPEATLAREAGVCYAAIAMATDYDCWHATEKPVSVEAILRTMAENAQKVKQLLVQIIPHITDTPCPCREAYKQSLL